MKLVNKLGIAVEVTDEQAQKLLALGYTKAEAPKKTPRKRPVKKEQ